MAVQWSVAWAKMELFVFWNVLFCADSVVYWGGTLCGEMEGENSGYGKSCGVCRGSGFTYLDSGGHRGFGRESGCSAL